MKKRKKPSINKATYEFWVNNTAGNDTGLYTTNTYHWATRRVKWHDIRKASDVARIALRDLWTITRDFLLIRSRSFYESSPSFTFSLSSTSGCTDKPAPSSNVIIDAQGQLKKRAGYTNTTCSASSNQNDQKSHQYGTKFYCMCGDKRCSNLIELRPKSRLKNRRKTRKKIPRVLRSRSKRER